MVFGLEDIIGEAVIGLQSFWAKENDDQLTRKKGKTREQRNRKKREKRKELFEMCLANSVEPRSTFSRDLAPLMWQRERKRCLDLERVNVCDASNIQAT